MRSTCPTHCPHAFVRSGRSLRNLNCLKRPLLSLILCRKNVNKNFHYWMFAGKCNIKVWAQAALLTICYNIVDRLSNGCYSPDLSRNVELQIAFSFGWLQICWNMMYVGFCMQPHNLLQIITGFPRQSKIDNSSQRKPHVVGVSTSRPEGGWSRGQWTLYVYLYII